MGSPTPPRPVDPRAHMEQLRRAEHARRRRTRALLAAGAAALVLTLGVGGALLANATDSGGGGDRAPAARDGAAREDSGDGKNPGEAPHPAHPGEAHPGEAAPGEAAPGGTAAPGEAAKPRPPAGVRSWDASKLGRDHVSGKVSYPMTPPVGGNHHDRWMTCDGIVYERPVRDENAVHSLEHGAVWVTYSKKARKADIAALANKVGRTPYTLMSPYDGQRDPLTLTAWGKQLSVDSGKDPAVDRFLAAYVQGPQTPEKGATCSGGLTR
ncbi:DUF3105 domain-containing protein [Streptomyces uncialis]|uniref:DUF3105 domain-containing protein n=1 Tax=Streptomyces uncialis TaxID=1048205 RepID=UPI0022577F36|nr:DUF3105 domain-containing protein [Streptomyces uncialis]MCX4663435.1 DUF3105 domain-containing protein [Streptomyces uncialis]WTE10506.1 DUF3105 domain-containing protein [Streptomyces uncialis]